MRNLLIATALAASFLIQPARADSDPGIRSVRVECEFANLHSFPFTAGKDRCWSDINGKTLAPRAVIACAHVAPDGRLSVTFRISEKAEPECDTEEAGEKVATAEQVARVVSLLGPRERSFVSAHSKSR